MKQVVQSYRTGGLVVDVPPPALKPGFVLVWNVASLVSVGTEKHMLEMAKKSLAGIVLAQPNFVHQEAKRDSGLFHRSIWQGGISEIFIARDKITFMMALEGGGL